jgi:hypothetical protein
MTFREMLSSLLPPGFEDNTLSGPVAEGHYFRILDFIILVALFGYSPCELGKEKDASVILPAKEPSCSQLGAPLSDAQVLSALDKLGRSSFGACPFGVVGVNPIPFLNGSSMGFCYQLRYPF